jgi:hypothetical protein
LVASRRRDRLVLDGWNLLGRILTLPFPVVAACTGNALAAGASLLLGTDVRLSADGAFKIGFNEAAIGLPIRALGWYWRRTGYPKRSSRKLCKGLGCTHHRMRSTPASCTVSSHPPSWWTSRSVKRGLVESAESFRREKQARVGPLADRLRRQLSEDIGLLRSFRV